jgi:hypothetical protein
LATRPGCARPIGPPGPIGHSRDPRWPRTERTVRHYSLAVLDRRVTGKVDNAL